LFKALRRHSKAIVAAVRQQVRRQVRHRPREKPMSNPITTPPPGLRHRLAGLRTALVSLPLALLAACGGGGDGTEAPAADALVARADGLNVGAGGTARLLANDIVRGGAATAGAGGNVTFALVTPASALPAGVTVVDGVVSVAGSVPPGSFTLTYQICEAGTANCAIARAVVAVTLPVLTANSDTVNVAPGGTVDLLANDTVGPNPATPADVVVSTATALPRGVTLAATGVLSVATNTRAGVYLMGYRMCQTGTTNCSTGAATLTVPGPDVVYGRVTDAASGAGVPGVRVSAGTLSATSDSNGDFEIASVPRTSRATVIFSSTTHAETARTTAVAIGATELNVRLLPLATTADLPVASGGTVTLAGSAAQVSLPADAVQRADGSLPTGNLRVRMTPINPAIDVNAMPGDYTTLVSGIATPIESFGALAVELVDDTGQVLNLRTGQSATLRIPLGSRNTSPPATVPLFWYDNASGRWVQEGSATLAGSGSGRYYEGTVSHFTVWNADRVYDTVRVNGCVADAAGVRVAGATVSTDGIDYSGATSAVTDANGDFTVLIKKDAAAIMVASAGGLPTNTQRIGPYSATTTISNCLAQGENGNGVTMKLTWGEQPRDLDSHLYGPDGSHVFYASRGTLTAAPFANLDVDDVSSFGPEVVTITRLMVGTYRYAVHNFSGQASGLFSGSAARVELSLAGRSNEVFTLPTSGETIDTDWWLLFEFDVDANCNITLRRTGTYVIAAPANSPAATPVYCTR
jgi:uncharacterized protein YfaP (DUF2135 family)